MSRFRGKVKSLFQKTHTFVFAHELRIARDHIQLTLKNLGFAPSEYRALSEELDRHLTALSRSADWGAKADELIEAKPELVEICLYERITEVYKGDGKGAWMDNRLAKKLKEDISQMRKTLQDAERD